MNSVLLRASARIVVPLQVLAALYVVVRGHDLPGGGFIGGLIAAAAMAFHALAFDVSSARSSLRITPHALCGFGLMIAGASGVLAVFRGESYMTGQWFGKLGTPLIFDAGVAFVVFGIVTAIVFSLFERGEGDQIGAEK
jgi:multicomponent Na+:H+ antiporter subunit B